MDRTQSLALLQQLHPKIRGQGIAAYNGACDKTPVNVHPYVVQVLRSFAESEYDYALGRTVVNPDGKSAALPMGNIVSNAKAGQSYHNYGLAVDVMLLVDGKNSVPPDALVVGIFEKYGFSWGGSFPGSFKDYPHFENRLSYSWEQLLAMYAAKKFIAGTEYLNL